MTGEDSTPFIYDSEKESIDLRVSGLANLAPKELLELFTRSFVSDSSFCCLCIQESLLPFLRKQDLIIGKKTTSKDFRDITGQLAIINTEKELGVCLIKEIDYSRQAITLSQDSYSNLTFYITQIVDLYKILLIYRNSNEQF